MSGDATQASNTAVSCLGPLTLRALRGLPDIREGDDLAPLLSGALRAEQLELLECDVLVVCSKIIAKAEGCSVDLSTIQPTAEALELAETVGKDARLVELILRDSERVSRAARDVLVVRHRCGVVGANAGIDQSNLRQDGAPGSGPWVLRLPSDPDASAERLRLQLSTAWGARVAVIVSDSLGRPFRLGTVGVAIGSAGLPPLSDQRGRADLYGRALEHTLTATADQLAATADLVAGQAAEASPVVLVRGLRFAPSSQGARALCRPIAGDLYL